MISKLSPVGHSEHVRAVWVWTYVWKSFGKSSFTVFSITLRPAKAQIALGSAIKISPKLKPSEVIIVNSCGDSLKDKDIIKQKLGSYSRWSQRLL